MKRISIKAALLVFAMSAMGCSLITDFDSADKFSLDDNLGDNLTVTLSSSGTGSLALQMAEELPDADDAVLLGLLDDGTITITVTNDETGTSHDLTEGARVDGTPADDGEYALSLSEDRTTLTVTFFNEISGASLIADEAYTVDIAVLKNKHFATESLSRAVLVQ